MPLHAWLPAMVAPTPVSAPACGRRGQDGRILRAAVFHVFGIGLMGELGLGIATAYLVSFTILMASVYALTRDDLKARLAYSTVSQLSYIVLGAVLLSPLAMVGGIVHIAAHAFSKITLFLCAGSIYCASGKRRISEMAASAAGCLDDGGVLRRLAQHDRVPPAAGFVSKWYMALGSVEAGEMPFRAAGELGAERRLFPAGELHRVLRRREARENPATVREIPLLAIPLVATAVLSLLIGIYPDYFLTLAEGVVR